MPGAGAESLKQADEDYFHDMDSGVALTPEEVAGATSGWSGPAATTGSGTA